MKSVCAYAFNISETLILILKRVILHNFQVTILESSIFKLQF